MALEGQMEQLELCRELFGSRVVTLAVLVRCGGVSGGRPPRNILCVIKQDLFRTRTLCLHCVTAKGVENVGGHFTQPPRLKTEALMDWLELIEDLIQSLRLSFLVEVN